MTATLACAVLSYRDEPFLPEAVRSVLAQGVAVEVVVVNSGGGDPQARLRAAGLDVPTYTVAARLYPGAVRNLGIANTRAPYVAFLAADCLAAPGWADARLRAHRDGADAVASAMTAADADSVASWAALLLLHNRRLALTRAKHRLHYSMSYARSLLDRMGPFREDLRAGEDTEFNARIPPDVRIAFAADALTAHRYPTRADALMREAFRRGRLHAATQGAIEARGPQRLRVALRTPWNLARAAVLAMRSRGSERAAMLQALPLVVAGGMAYSAGALTAFGADAGD